MEKIVKRIFQPILRIFESDDGEYHYEKSHRKILIAMGVLFLALSAVSAVLAIISSQMGGLIPFLVFFMIGLVCEVVGWLGSNRAVAKIWGSK
jgi:isoprenylcysteine carboxyl methyltransferase (ICMT) family protein YpbQ